MLPGTIYQRANEKSRSQPSMQPIHWSAKRQQRAYKSIREAASQLCHNSSVTAQRCSQMNNSRLGTLDCRVIASQENTLGPRSDTHDCLYPQVRTETHSALIAKCASRTGKWKLISAQADSCTFNTESHSEHRFARRHHPCPAQRHVSMKNRQKQRQ